MPNASPQIKVVIFDYGNVITNAQPEEAVLRMAALLDTPPERFQEAYRRHRDAHDQGVLSDTAYWQAVAHDLGRAPTDELLRELSGTDGDSWSSVNEAMISWAADLEDAGFHLAILSNMPKEFYRKRLVTFPWIELFPVHIISGELGICKPNAAIYREAASRVAHPPEACLFLDDNPVNTEGARAVGMHAVTFRGPAATAAELAPYGLPPLREHG